MTTIKAKAKVSARLLLVAAASASALAVTGCRHTEPGTRVAGWTLVDAAQRHPILVSKKPRELDLEVPHGSSGLSPRQRAQVISFYSAFRRSDAGTGRIIVHAPSGSPNEVAAMRAVNEVAHILELEGADSSIFMVEPYYVDGDPQPPVKLSFMHYVAEAPECGDWSTNLGESPANLPYPNLGCATQRNFAQMIANPSDLLYPRGMTPRSSERRDMTWDKYTKGEVSGAKKSKEEQIKTRKQDD